MFEKNSYKNSSRKAKIQYSNSTLKIVFYILITIGTIGVCIVERNILKIDNYTIKELAEAMKNDGNVMFYSTVVIFTTFITSFALPIAAQLIIDGYEHTSNLKKYIIRVLICALVSEIPYDLAMRGKFFDMTSQNPAFSILITLVVIYFLDHFRDIKKLKGILFKLMIFFAAAMWMLMLRANMGLFILFVTVVMYLLAGNGAMTVAAGCMACMLDFPAPLGYIFNYFYNGDKGKINRMVFYVYYPLHLLVLGLIGKYIM